MILQVMVDDEGAMLFEHHQEYPVDMTAVFKNGASASFQHVASFEGRYLGTISPTYAVLSVDGDHTLFAKCGTGEEITIRINGTPPQTFHPKPGERIDICVLQCCKAAKAAMTS